MFRSVIICLTFGAMLLPTLVEAATTRAAKRESIKQMPILERPYRVGHVYGNTVRRRAQ